MNIEEITTKLLAFGEKVSTETLLPTVVPEAAPLVATDPYAFAIAVCLDRGMRAEIVWTIPYYMKTYLGHLDPHRIHRMTDDELAEMFAGLPHKPRYVNAARRTVRELTRFVVEECDGDASRIWKDKAANVVHKTLDDIYGVGPGIAGMGVLLIEKAFGVHFDDLDRKDMDIKPDVHTVRVLYRLGASKAETIPDAIAASRKMNPEFPGGLDGALWEIGRRWCSPGDPNCPECPMTTLCAKRLQPKRKPEKVSVPERYARKHGEITAEIGRSLRIESFDIYNDHDIQGDHVGHIVSYFGGKNERSSQLSHVDMAIVRKDSLQVAVLVEIEETNDTPKTLFGDSMSVLAGDYLVFQGKILEVGEWTALIVAGIGAIKHEDRIRHIEEIVGRTKSELGTKNSSIGRILVRTYTDERDLLTNLPLLIESVITEQS